MNCIKSITLAAWFLTLILIFPQFGHSQEISIEFAKIMAIEYISQLIEEDPNWDGTEVTDTSVMCFDPYGDLKSILLEITQGSLKGLIEVSADGTGKVLRIARTPTPRECALALYQSLGEDMEMLRDDLKHMRTWIVSGEDGFYLESPWLAAKHDLAEPYPLRYQKSHARELFHSYSLSLGELNQEAIPINFMQLINFMCEDVFDNSIKNEYEQGKKWLLAMSVGLSLKLGGIGVVCLVDIADLAQITPESEDDWVTVYLDFEAYIGVSLWSFIANLKNLSGLIPVFGIVKQEPFPFYYGDEDPDRKEELEFISISPFAYHGGFWTSFSVGTNGISLGDEIWMDASVKLINSHIPLLSNEVRRGLLLNTCEENFWLNLLNNAMDPFGLREMVGSILSVFFCQIGSEWGLCQNIGFRTKTPNDGSITLDNGVPEHNLHGTFDTKRYYKIEVPSSATKLTVKTWGGVGNCDIYVKYGTQPSKTDFDYASVSSNNEETVEMPGNIRPGHWHIMVYAETEYAYTTLMAEYLVLTIPNRPTYLSAKPVSSGQINLSWSDNSNNEDGFRIERKKGTNGIYVNINNVGTNSTSYQDKGLEANTTYFYRVRAFNQIGNSGYSNVASATTAGKNPTAPTNLQVAALSYDRISLSWMDNSINEQGFCIERKKGTSGTYALIESTDPNVTSFMDTGLEANTTYYYRVRAFNASGYSAYSNEAGAATTGMEEKDYIALWHFDEGAGNTAYDSSSYNNNGEVHGATWTAGKSGYALKFDGINDYVEVLNKPVLNPTSITITLWVKIGSLTYGGGEEPMIIEKSRAFAVGRPQYRIMINKEGSQNKFLGSIAIDGVGYNVFTNKVLSLSDLNRWIFIALTFDRDKLQIYVDGKREGINSDPSGPLDKNSNWNVFIGREANYEHHHFNGVIDEIRIYDRSLSQSEIQKIFQTTSTIFK